MMLSWKGSAVLSKEGLVSVFVESSAGTKTPSLWYIKQANVCAVLIFRHYKSEMEKCH